MQTQGYVSRFEPLLYVPAFTQKDFHYVHTGPPTQGTSTEEFANTTLGVHNSSLQHPPLYKRQGTKPKQQSPLHKRDEHKSKTKKRLQLGDHLDHNLLVITKDLKQNTSHK